MPENDENNAVNEEAASYQGKKKLSEIFPGIHMSSLEEQDELRRKYSASLSPLERMAYMHQLILIAYAEELKKPKDELWNKTIIFDKIKW